MKKVPRCNFYISAFFHNFQSSCLTSHQEFTTFSHSIRDRLNEITVNPWSSLLFTSPIDRWTTNNIVYVPSLPPAQKKSKPHRQFLYYLHFHGRENEHQTRHTRWTCRRWLRRPKKNSLAALSGLINYYTGRTNRNLFDKSWGLRTPSPGMSESNRGK